MTCDGFGMSRCFCCLLLGLAQGEDKSFLLQQRSSSKSSALSQLYSLYDVEDKEDGKTKGNKKLKPSKEIQVIWANNPETNEVFTKLGAIDIVLRYDRLLNEWKYLKDAEKEFKQVMGLDQDKDLVQCIDSIPPDMRIGFSHDSSQSESEYEFHLDIDPLVSLEKLNAPLTLNLKRAMHLFTVVSKQMNIIQVTGAAIIKDLQRLVSLFKLNEPFVEINGVQHSVELLNSQQVEQAYLIIKDIVSLTGGRSQAMMEYILQQGDKVDLQVIKDDPNNHKVIIFSKKLSYSKKRKT